MLSKVSNGSRHTTDTTIPEDHLSSIGPTPENTNIRHTTDTTIPEDHLGSIGPTPEDMNIRHTTDTMIPEDHHSSIGPTPKAMKIRGSTNTLRQCTNHGGNRPQGYYRQSPYQPQHRPPPPPPRGNDHAPSPQDEQEQYAIREDRAKYRKYGTSNWHCVDGNDILMDVEIADYLRYGTSDWHRVDEFPPVDPDEAQEEDIQDRVLFYLNEYLVHKVQGRVLRRRFREDFEGWTKPTWSRVSEPLRTKLRHELETYGLIFNPNLSLVPDMLAEYVEQGQRKRPAKESSAGTTPRPSPAHTSAPAPATAGSEEQLAMKSHEDASADRQEREEILSEGYASAQPECVSSSKEKPSADPVDQTVADHDMSDARASKVNLTVPRENEDLVGKNDEETPATELPDLEDSPANALLAALTVSKDPAADEILGDPPDPHDRKPEDHEEERTVGIPEKKESSEDPVPEDHAVNRDSAADEGPTDPLHRRRRPADPPDKKTISADPTADGDPLASADHVYVEKLAKTVGEGSRVLSEKHPDKDTALQLKDPRDENPFTPFDRDPSEIPTDSLDGIKRRRKKKRHCEGKYIFSVPSLVVITFLLINFFRYLGKHCRLVERLVP
ncbi:hypothetical protein E4U22_003105 [Claviceps purpurea]|nr:hypothetical protein E4U22_003105 [Claviceps purpurea]